MLGCLALIRPLNVVSGARVDVRVSSMGAREHAGSNGLDGQKWVPAMVGAPTVGIALWNGDFQSAVDTTSAALTLHLDRLVPHVPAANHYAWGGASVEIWVGEPGDAWPWTKLFTGKVTSYSAKHPGLSLTAQVDLEPLRAEVLTTYAGTGGAEGGADIKNKAKPLVLGHAKNVEPVLIDATNDVWQFSGYGAIAGVSKLYERGSDFGAATGDHATYAALVAATIPAGRWATCLAQGMIRLGAPAFGLITGDVEGHKVSGATPRRTGAMISALATLAGVSGTVLDAATFAALDVAVPYDVNLLLDTQTTFLDIAQRITLPCNWQAGVTPTGVFFVSAIDLDAAADVTLNATGGAIPVIIDGSEQETSPPYSTTTMGAARAWRVHSNDEISFFAPLNERGDWSVTDWYREGHWVRATDGSTWIYTNTAPSSGNALPTWPATSNAWWENRTPPNATFENFDARNDRIPTPVVAPTVDQLGNAVTHALNTVGSCDIKFEWSYPADEAAKIDWFEVSWRSSVIAGSFTPGDVPAVGEERWMVSVNSAIVPPQTYKAGSGVAAVDVYHSPAVRAVRVVDPDIDPSGVMFSAWVKPGASESPYLPSSTPSIASNVLLDGVAATNIRQWSGWAAAGLNSDGTVQASKVNRFAIINLELLNRGWLQLGSTISVLAGTAYVHDASSPFSINGEDTTVEAQIPYYFVMTNPVKGNLYFATFRVRLYNTATGVSTIGREVVVEYRWDFETAAGTKYSPIFKVDIKEVFSGLGSGSYRYGYSVLAHVTNGVILPPYRYLIAHDTRAS